ncbi:hypothetical protein KIN20_000785 [Parelaphostrongylus tenuis]|uniref:Uncharacterized protein n=1 Tax=Parelaphostrongylus tenuis TaxID=148309 RepID=A0AAD5MEA2_PARTN|nr:hypothetical protein KIN20_000785 [Parelaphostrongylus tenuis]
MAEAAEAAKSTGKAHQSSANYEVVDVTYTSHVGYSGIRQPEMILQFKQSFLLVLIQMQPPLISTRLKSGGTRMPSEHGRS